MSFPYLTVYISRWVEGGLRARVVMEAKHGRVYGSNLLKRHPTSNSHEGVSTCINELLGTTAKIHFQFQPEMKRDNFTYIYETDSIRESKYAVDSL